MTGWKRLFVIGAGFGTGAVLTATLVVLLFVWYQSRPKPDPQWNSSAIQGHFNELTLQTGDQVLTRFTYMLENTTDHDYTVEPTTEVAIMIVLPEKKGLNQDPTLVMSRAAYIPAKQKVSITIDKAFDYDQKLPKEERSDDAKLTAFIERKLANMDGFVLFDKDHHYMINLPNGWGKKQRLNDTGNFAPAPSAQRALGH
jgi:hypothetical protein